MRLRLLCFLLVTLCAAPLVGQTGMISASPSPCTVPVGQTQCTSQITWQSQGTSYVQVFYSINGGTQALWAWTVPNGFGSWQWTEVGKTYTFYLYDFSSGSLGALLASSQILVASPTLGILTFSNQTRTITPHFVFADTWSLSVTGASAGLPVHVNWTDPQGNQTLYLLGYTNSSGNFPLQGPTSSSSTGEWSAEWFVSGQLRASNMTEIINLPTSVSRGLIFPGSEDCSASYPQPYGFGVRDLSYRLNQAVNEIIMTSQVVVSGSGSLNVDIANGPIPTFEDPHNPLGFCSASPITGSNTGYLTENIYINIGGITGPSVRTNYWELTSGIPHKGQMTNNNDFTITR